MYLYCRSFKSSSLSCFPSFVVLYLFFPSVSVYLTQFSSSPQSFKPAKLLVFSYFCLLIFSSISLPPRLAPLTNVTALFHLDERFCLAQGLRLIHIYILPIPCHKTDVCNLIQGWPKSFWCPTDDNHVLYVINIIISSNGFAY